MKNARYSYGILKENYPDLAKESTLLDNNYKETKFALIEKQNFSDGSEVINRIIYSNDQEKLTVQLINYITWYNYINGKSKNIQGYISDLP